MKRIQFAFLAFCIVSVIAGAIYYVSMHAAGKFDISSNNQDWGGFGSYIGGIISPAASLLAAYMVYVGFSSNSHQLKLTLAREALARLDSQLEKNLNSTIYNGIHGEIYVGESAKDMIIDLSNKNIQINENTEKFILAILHNVAMLTNSIYYYMQLSKEIHTNRRDEDWLGELERFYWIDKYSAICRRMINLVGEEKFEAKVKPDQLKSFKIVMRGEDRN